MGDSADLNELLKGHVAWLRALAEFLAPNPHRFITLENDHKEFLAIADAIEELQRRG